MEKALKDAFESGYSNAVTSLMQLIRNKVYFNNFLYGSYAVETASLTNGQQSAGPKLLLTTEIFGDITGKSYLLLSDTEFDLLTAGIPESKDPQVDLKQEFIKEMDNILSASVITHLSNELGFKIYGDIPTLVEKSSGKIEDLIYDDFNEQSEEVYVNAMFFSFDDHPALRPLFIWVMDCQVLSKVEEKIISSR